MSANLGGKGGGVGNATFGLAVDIKPLQQGLAAAEQLARQSASNIQQALNGAAGAQGANQLTTIARQAQTALQQLAQTTTQVGTSSRAMQQALQQSLRQVQTQLTTTTQQLTQLRQSLQQTQQQAQQGITIPVQAATAPGINATGGVGSAVYGPALPAAPVSASTLAGLSTVIAQLGLAAEATKALNAAFKDIERGVISFNADLEQDAIRLETFTGSLTTATDHLRQLQQLAANPAGGGFQFGDLEKGEEILQRFGQANERTRQMVADVAAGTGQSYAYIAQYIGEMYDRLDNGLPVARTVLTLERLGIITGDYARQLDAAAKAGASQAEVNDLITASLARYQGAAKEQGDTLTASLNETRQALSNLEAEAGKSIFVDIEHGLADVRGIAESGVIQKPFELMGTVIGFIGKQALLDLDSIKVAVLSVASVTADAFAKLASLLPGLSDGQKTAIADFAQGLDDQRTQAYNDFSKFLAGAQPDARTGGTDTGKAFGQGFQNAATAYYKDLVASLSQPDLTALNDITTQVTTYLKNQIDSQGQPLDITPQIKLDLAEVVGQQGDFQQAAERLKQELGTEEYNAVLQLASAYQQLATDTVVVNYAQGSLADTTAKLKDVQDQAKVATQQADDAVKAAQATAQQHAQTVQDAVQAIRDQVDALDRDQRQVDAGLQTTIDGLTRQQKALQDASKERQQQYQDELKQQQAVLTGLNDQLKADRDNATTHADAFKAVEQGTLDIFYQEHDAIDATTRKIIERYQAEIDGAERAKEATADKAGNLEADQRKQLLALDEQIQTARENNDTGRLAALEAERKAFVEKSQPQIDLERERAAVAADDYNARVKGVQQAADKQAAADKAKENTDQKAVDAQQTKIKGIQDAQQAQQAADQQALDNLNQQIQQVQEEKKQRDQAFSDRKQQLSDEQQDIERNGRAQAALDAQHVKDTQQAAQNVKDYWQTQIDNAQHNKDIADATLKAAQDKEKADNDDLKHIQDIIKAQDEFYTKYPTLLPGAKNIDPGATPGPGGDHPTPQDWQTPAPTPPSTPNGVGPTAAARPLFQPASAVQASAASRPINVNINNPVISDVVGANQVKQLVAEGVTQGLNQQAADDRAMFQDIVRGGAPAGALIG